LIGILARGITFDTRRERPLARAGLERLVAEKWSSSVQLQVESFGRLSPFPEITCLN
jgi:hypothetical protein